VAWKRRPSCFHRRTAAGGRDALSEAAAAFERSLASGKQGKVVIQVVGEGSSGKAGSGA
jgi:hypothetical protein